MEKNVSKPGWAGCEVHRYDVTDSTNLQAQRLAGEGAPHGAVVTADMQTAGRGRRGRRWESPAGASLYFTILLRPDFPVEKASMITLVMAHSVAKGLHRYHSASVCGEEAADSRIAIKWPNDLILHGKKLCGILTELSLCPQGRQESPDDVSPNGVSPNGGTSEYFVVVGVGVNIKHQEFPPDIADRAVCLEDVWEVCVDRDALLGEILAAFEADYERFRESGDLSPLLDSYQALLVNRDREVCVLDPSGEYRGTARGITPTGELIVELSDGRRENVYAGEVSVRGVYGYC